MMSYLRYACPAKRNMSSSIIMITLSLYLPPYALIMLRIKPREQISWMRDDFGSKYRVIDRDAITYSDTSLFSKLRLEYQQIPKKVRGPKIFLKVS